MLSKEEIEKIIKGVEDKVFRDKFGTLLTTPKDYIEATEQALLAKVEGELVGKIVDEIQEWKMGIVRMTRHEDVTLPNSAKEEANVILSLISPQLLKYKEEIERLKGESELFWQTTNAIKHDLECRHWITEGRGSYAHDDERYRKETGWAFDAIRDLIDKAQKQSKGENYIQQAVQQEREKVKTELSKEALPDSAEYETGEGFKCHKVFFFTRTKWDNFWKALQDNTK